ncbi:hypothetical protein AAFF_G00036060 [Aldrovandia affinis]|uniref:Uncharacterized protein n=1 Tax=Aldrovandia affinis TaxID=143900 RepID=A0AAD7S3C8_9TELE|nr:hypothetical protein AAFF_G00036060 [Aldrovandia affinis]
MFPLTQIHFLVFYPRLSKGSVSELEPPRTNKSERRNPSPPNPTKTSLPVSSWQRNTGSIPTPRSQHGGLNRSYWKSFRKQERQKSTSQCLRCRNPQSRNPQSRNPRSRNPRSGALMLRLTLPPQRTGDDVMQGDVPTQTESPGQGKAAAPPAAS